MYAFEHEVFRDRTFWIYLIITLVVIVIGASLILSSNINYLSVILIAWIATMLLLMLMVYFLIIDTHNLSERLIVNFLYIAILFFSILWTNEITAVGGTGGTGASGSASSSVTYLGIFIIILILFLIIQAHYKKYIIFAALALFIWFFLTFYFMTL